MSAGNPPARAMRPHPERSILLWIVLIIGAVIWSMDLLIFALEGASGFADQEWHAHPYFLGPLFIAAAYGVHRAWAYHPLFNLHYLTWLRTVPWRAPAPLPFGTVLPHWIDGLVLSILILVVLSLNPIVAAVAIIATMVLAYVVTIAPVLSATRLHRHVYALAALLGLGILAYTNVWIVAGLSVAALLIATDGTRRSLASLPLDTWNQRPEISLGAAAFESALRQSRQPGIAQSREQMLSWTFSALAQRDPQPIFTRERSILIPLIIGWLILAVLYRYEWDTGEQPASGLGLLLAMGAALLRLGIYIVGRTPPLSIAGRIALRMPIIPRYDVALIGPLAAAAVAYLLWRLLIAAQAPLAFVNALPAATALWIVLLCPPTLGKWDLTGAHRMSPRPATQPTNRNQPRRA